MKIAKETWIIASIGVADLVTTIVFIRSHGAQEANPLFRHYWEMGIPAFVLAKLVCLAGPLMVLEWARQHRPRFVARALRTAILGYLVFYGIGYFRLNGPAAAAAEVAPRTMSSEMAIYAHERLSYSYKGWINSGYNDSGWMRRRRRMDDGPWMTMPGAKRRSDLRRTSTNGWK